ncbi:AbiU2 domain-containing protein [Aurantimonas sp. E1-2-R+4]|uniref:AbiU2 domain-containing protein n=1 Tax=Aurantimonas sp. E1-2-R+4 TaxID=3113714 RepID=UPI003FA56A6F
MQRSKQQIERIARWREAFCDDTTGIHKTVQDLLWNYAAFRTTVKILRLANERRDERAPLNQMLFNLISEGYWSSLLLGTRRLLDKAPLSVGPESCSI